MAACGSERLAVVSAVSRMESSLSSQCGTAWSVISSRVYVRTKKAQYGLPLISASAATTTDTLPTTPRRMAWPATLSEPCNATPMELCGSERPKANSIPSKTASYPSRHFQDRARASGISSLQVDREQALWIATSDGLFRLERRNDGPLHDRRMVCRPTALCWCTRAQMVICGL